MKNKSTYAFIAFFVGIGLILYKAVSVLLGKNQQNKTLLETSSTSQTEEIPEMALGGYNQSYLDLINPFSFSTSLTVNTAKRTTRGYRNNNPGNLVYVKALNWKERRMPRTDKKFEEFTKLNYGIAAMIKVLANNIDAGKTLEELINKYAPPSENNTIAYMKSAAKKVGLESVKSTMNRSHLKALTITLIHLENSSTISDAEYQDAYYLYNQYYA